MFKLGEGELTLNRGPWPTKLKTSFISAGKSGFDHFGVFYKIKNELLSYISKSFL